MNRIHQHEELAMKSHACTKEAKGQNGKQEEERTTANRRAGTGGVQKGEEVRAALLTTSGHGKARIMTMMAIPRHQSFGQDAPSPPPRAH